MSHRKKILGFLFLFIPSFSLAASFMCPSGAPYVRTGDTITQVIAACGTPTQQIDVKQQANEEKKRTEWVYQRDQKHFSQLRLFFEGGKLIGIRSGEYATPTTLCPRGGRVQLGNTEKQVQEICGQPSAMNNISQSSTAPAQQKQVKLIYKRQSYLPIIEFKFENGKLVGQ